MERELAFAYLQEQRRLAYKIAEEREKLNWSVCGGALMVVLSALSSYHHKNLLHILPVFPISSYLGYKAHYCYGDQLQRVNVAASNLIEEKSEALVPTPLSVVDVKNRATILKNFEEEDLEVV